jgi:hypothetical protein
VFLKNDSIISTSRFPPLGLPRDRNSPASPVLSRRYDALPPSCRTSFPSLGSTSVAPAISLLDGRVHRRGLELVTRCLQPGIRRGANRVLPSSWGTPIVRLHMFQSDAGRTAYTRPYSAAAWPLVIERQRLPRKVFRRSIAWLSNSLSTLRDVSYPSTTQDSLPVAGQALLDGLFTRKVPLKGFKVVIYITFPFPKLCLAQRNCPRCETDRRFDASDARSS